MTAMSVFLYRGASFRGVSNFIYKAFVIFVRPEWRNYRKTCAAFVFLDMVTVCSEFAGRTCDVCLFTVCSSVDDAFAPQVLRFFPLGCSPCKSWNALVLGVRVVRLRASERFAQELPLATLRRCRQDCVRVSSSVHRYRLVSSLFLSSLLLHVVCGHSWWTRNFVRSIRMTENVEWVLSWSVAFVFWATTTCTNRPSGKWSVVYVINAFETYVLSCCFEARNSGFEKEGQDLGKHSLFLWKFSVEQNEGDWCTRRPWWQHNL